ncbi:MAG: hypothetical protein ACR2JX_00280, partial [Mycobacteriales bacterium]
GDIYKGDKEVRQANTPTHTINLPRQHPLNFNLITSSGDREGLGGLKELAPRIKEPDTLTKTLIGKGGHNFGMWRRALPQAFIWIGKHCEHTAQ